jgi:hypothetical protein
MSLEIQLFSRRARKFAVRLSRIWNATVIIILDAVKVMGNSDVMKSEKS